MHGLKRCTAMFQAPPTATLTVIRVGQGTVTSAPTGIACGLDCTEVYVQGTQVTLSADVVVNTGRAQFVGNVSLGNATRTLTVNAGEIASMTSGYADKGTYTSAALDATQVSRFGKLQLHGTF